MAQPSQALSMTNATSNISQQSQKTKTNVDKLINDFIQRHATVVVEDCSTENKEKVIKFAKVYYVQLADERRRLKIFRYVASKEDNGELLQNFTSAWLYLMRFVENDLEAHRLAALRCIFSALETTDISVHNFVSIYNNVNLELPKISVDSVISLVNAVSERVKEESTKAFKRRWRDCVLVLVTYLTGVKEISVNGVSMHGRLFASQVLADWLQTAGNRVNYRHVITIAKDVGMIAVVEKFLTDTVLEIDDVARAETSWRAVASLDHVDQKMCHRLLLALNSTWPTAEETISIDVLYLMSSLKKVIVEAPSVGKSLISLFKQQPGPVLTSEFGFIALLVMCGIERYRVQAVQEMKRTLNKLWKFDDEIAEHGWLKDSEVGDTAETVRKQIGLLVNSLGMDVKTTDIDEAPWMLFGQSLLNLGQALLECPSSKEVTVVDGRVADACPLWLFAQHILKETLLSNTSAIPSQLVHIVHAIASAAQNGAALILIDVLVDIVKKCTLEVLNNSKLLDGLFDYVCKMRRDVAVSLIRCLLPVINHRAQLRQALFHNLKSEMLNETSVGAAIPILILLLRSVSQKKCLTAGGNSNFSQSFASFSTQTLDAMGMKPAVDDAVALEIVGILKRCLTQPAPSKIVLYEGITEAASRCPNLVAPCLDLLVDHALSVPKWSPTDMVITAKNVTQLKEPLPQLIQALECLCYESMTADPVTATQITDEITERATRLLDSWVEKAVSEDVHDLGVDKVSEWNPTTPGGRATFVFAYMISSLYDVLIEHTWRQVEALKRERDTDNLIGLLRRRNELAVVLAEKTVKRKEAKVGATEAATFDMAQGEVFTSAQSIASILDKLVPTNSTTEDIETVKEDLFIWSVDRALNLSKDLLRVHHPLHSLISSASHLITVAGHLIDFYIGVDCAQWMRAMEYDHPVKTKAIETYANICRFICTKYKSTPSKIIQIWQKDVQMAGTQVGTQGSGPIGSMVRHMHLMMTKIYPALLALDRNDAENKKRMALEVEKQTKSLIKTATAILSVTTSTKAANAIFKFLAKMISQNTFSNNAVFRDLLKFISCVGLRSSDSEHLVMKELNTMADEVIQVLSDEGDEQKYACITNSSQQAMSEFLITTAEKMMQSLKSAVAFAAEFSSKDASLDAFLSVVINKTDECSGIISRVLPLHTQFHVMKERLVMLLTVFFSTVETPVDIMLANHKLIPEMVEWNSLTALSELLKKKVQAIMAIADENVGVWNPELDDPRGNAKRKLAKTKRDEGTYMKYVKSRESLQSKVLMLCSALKDDRLNLVIKNNSIGIRDFRLNMNVLTERLQRNDDDDEEEPTPKRKKKKALETPPTTQPTQHPDEDEENVEENEADTSAVY